MSYDLYKNLNTLKEFSFIAGTEQILPYMVYEVDGITPTDISAMTTKLVVCPYGQPDYKIIEKPGVISGTTTGLFVVTLTLADTRSLSGVYVQQPTVIDFFGKEFVLAQGLFTVIPKIGG